MSRYQFLTMLFVIHGFASQLMSQTVIGPEGPRNPERTQNITDDGFHLRRLTISPAAEADPPLQHSLYLRVTELEPGNSVPLWYRSIHSLQGDQRIGELFDLLDKREVPVERFREIVQTYQWTYKTMAQATRRQSTEWDLQSNQLRGEDTIQFRLGEFQESRELARLLGIKTRLHIEQGEFGKALETMQISFRLAHDVAEPDMIINTLIGTAIQAITMANVERMISQPDSPNLYWALAAMPDPLIDMRRSLEAEMTLAERYFPWLSDPEGEKRTDEEWNQLLRETLREATRSLDALGGLNPDLPDQHFEQLYTEYVAKRYPEAKKLLVESGRTAKEVEEMSKAKALALREHLLYKKYSQAAMVNVLLPLPESMERYEAIRVDLEELSQKTIVVVLLPAFQQAYVAGERRSAFRNAVMAVEAIRMHMAEHDGVPPKTLDEIEVVPVPNFPFTGQPFLYKNHGDQLTLDVPIPNYPVRYIIELH